MERENWRVCLGGRLRWCERSGSAGCPFIVRGEGHGRVPWAHWPPLSQVKRRKERGSWRWLGCWSTG
jgi:hypothetical protein